MILPRGVQLPRAEDALNLVARQIRYGRWYVQAFPTHFYSKLAQSDVEVTKLTIIQRSKISTLSQQQRIQPLGPLGRRRYPHLLWHPPALPNSVSQSSPHSQNTPTKQKIKQTNNEMKYRTDSLSRCCAKRRKRRAALHSTPMTAPSGHGHHNSGYNAGYNNGGYNQQYAPPAGAPPQYGNAGYNNDYYGQQNGVAQPQTAYVK